VRSRPGTAPASNPLWRSERSSRWHSSSGGAVPPRSEGSFFLPAEGHSGAPLFGRRLSLRAAVGGGANRPLRDPGSDQRRDAGRERIWKEVRAGHLRSRTGRRVRELLVEVARARASRYDKGSPTRFGGWCWLVHQSRPRGTRLKIEVVAGAVTDDAALVEDHLYDLVVDAGGSRLWLSADRCARIGHRRDVPPGVMPRSSASAGSDRAEERDEAPRPLVSRDDDLRPPGRPARCAERVPTDC